jgi:serine protease Do
VSVLGRRIAVLAASLALVAAFTASPVSAQSPAASPPTSKPAQPKVPQAPAPTKANTAPVGAQASPTANQAPASSSPLQAQAAPKLPIEVPFADLFAQLAKQVVGVVVNISTQTAPPASQVAQQAPQTSPGTTLDEVFRDFFGDKGSPGGPGSRIASLGSGFIIDPSGLIVTNNHVIANAEQITVTLSDDTSLQAHVVGRDPVTDLALLKVDAKTPLPAATWGDSNTAKVGDWVLTIGNPFGLGGTVTAGIISATARDINTSPYDDYLQTDASINRGNSGGPMFNLVGQVIGINTAIYSPSGGSIGIGFALPAALAQPIIEQLKSSGKVERGWIGAHIQPMTDALAESVELDKSRGAMIAAVDPGSPADGKLKPGDVILSYDGQAIERSRQLPRLVAATLPGKQVKLVIWRDGKQSDVDINAVALDLARPPPPPPEAEKPKPPTTVDAFGLKLAKVTAELRKQFSLPDWATGVVVTEVTPNSVGAEQGVQPGDLIVAVGQNRITSPEQVPTLAASVKKANRKAVLVRVQGRDGSMRFVAVAPEPG